MMRMLFTSFAVLLIAAAAASQPNVLLIIADDVGVDRVGAYGEHPDPGHTPVIDQLAEDGILFRNAWSNPICSATRATLLTGRYSFRTGIGKSINYTTAIKELALDEVTIPKILRPAYFTAAAGKWHLGARRGSNLMHPLLLGFQHYRGSMRSLPGPKGAKAYFEWKKNIDGTQVRSTTYATTDTVDDALMFIAQFSASPAAKPWFLWLAFNAPHKPYHKPPAALHSFDLPGDPDRSQELGHDPVYMKAITEAMDTEIGRLLANMDAGVRENTVVIFLGDNGTVSSATTPPFDPEHGKHSLFEGGINVPLIITGPGIARRAECEGLVNTTDILATVVELAGLPLVGFEDSVSLVPYFRHPERPSLRSWVYAERFLYTAKPRTKLSIRAARGPRYKVRVYEDHERTAKTFYDLEEDPFEKSDLLTRPLSEREQEALNRLLAVVEHPGPATWTSIGGGRRGLRGVPALVGTGTLLAHDPVSLLLCYVPERIHSALVLAGYGPRGWYRDGVASPLAATSVLGLNRHPAGNLAIESVWPVGVPRGQPTYFQSWISRGTASSKLMASNAVLATAP